MVSWASDVASHDADVHAIYTPNQRILQEIGDHGATLAIYFV
jgi:hypothetical protein